MISVIVPVYKVEQYLNRCIDSILNQTYTDFELILIDDGSPDNCPTICDEYAKKDSRIIVVHQENKGLSSARNAGLDICKGDYVTFIDSDDLVHPQYLEILYNSLIDYNGDISLCHYITFYSDNEIRIEKNNHISKVLGNTEACKAIHGKSSIEYVTAWGKLYKIGLFNQLRFPEGKINEDEYVTYKLYYKSQYVVDTNVKLYFYRQHNESIMNRKFNIKRYDLFGALEERMNFYKRNNEYDLFNMTKSAYEVIISMYAIQARSNKIYHLVDDKYKQSIIYSILNLKRKLSNDAFEFFLFDYYPKIVIFNSYINKVLSIIGIKNRRSKK